MGLSAGLTLGAVVTAGAPSHAAHAGPTPDGDEARRWAEQELSDPVYDVAEPTPFDRIARGVADFFERLFATELSGEWGPAVAVVAAIVVLILIGVAFAIWGIPRSSRRAQVPSSSLFGEAEIRSAAELRSAAESHARKAEWDAAIVLHFRALARGCSERGVVDTPPGATVHAFARAAARVFPHLAGELERSAAAFDDVRYLRRPGTAALYRQVAETDGAVVAAKPLVAAEVPA
ncbi:DUF4129 domain-containing protein [Microbacterium sp. CFH 31415]|uniref:DUF4129 domain-containing protein n=1 Tax=Microbacterium sp. CFH 31415 TaxID=2921732 RepID=UPI001F1293D4|nr:DUF4129 domain-containing protein [Microbacterium sp. CFH 31415]MCH6231318.1 DUF4129 domain-containing protein [Microbacterium sp. CFH 31415]